MNDARRVQRREPGEDLVGDRQRARAAAALAPDQGAERRPFEEVHREPGAPVGEAAVIEHRDHVGVSHAPRVGDLLGEASAVRAVPASPGFSTLSARAAPCRERAA